MTNQAYADYIKTQPLVTALFWFIENMAEDDPDRNELFQMLRERVRTETHCTVHFTDKWGAKHRLTHDGASDELSAIYNEWPGGLEEIESALRTARGVKQ